MRRFCVDNSPINPALQLAFFASAAAASCRNLILLRSPLLISYSNRLGRLINGGTGKEQSGFISVSGDVPRNTIARVQIAAFIFFTQEGERDPELIEKREVFRYAGVPLVSSEITDTEMFLPETFQWEMLPPFSVPASD